MADASASNLPSCRCGTDRTSRNAVPEREYSVRGTLYALWGGTPVPILVTWRCLHCGEVFDSRKDIETRRAMTI